MKLKGINNGSKKTILLIKNAFAELLEEKKEINNITVTELVKRANITRGAFYSHFDNIYDVAKVMENEIQDFAFSNIKKITLVNGVNDFIDILFNYLKENESLYEKLLRSNDPILFMNRISHKFLNAIKDVIKTNRNDFDLALNFYTDGAAILLIKYFRKETSFTLDDIASYLKQVFPKIFY